VIVHGKIMFMFYQEKILFSWIEVKGFSHYFFSFLYFFLHSRQIEIVLQFCTGTIDVTDTYCDNFSVISTNYLASPRGFWFDVITSIPWSYNDLYAYKVVHVYVFSLFGFFWTVSK
jgi:hypothetical protein